jgi:hypothetical protein
METKQETKTFFRVSSWRLQDIQPVEVGKQTEKTVTVVRPKYGRVSRVSNNERYFEFLADAERFVTEKLERRVHSAEERLADEQADLAKWREKMSAKYF